jgi:hypothetical protein
MILDNHSIDHLHRYRQTLAPLLVFRRYKTGKDMLLFRIGLLFLVEGKIYKVPDIFLLHKHLFLLTKNFTLFQKLILI